MLIGVGTKRSLVLVVFAALILVESVYFGRQCLASVIRLAGERAFFANNQKGAWRQYQRSHSLGGDRALIEVDMIELILFGLDQLEAGIPIETPLTLQDSLDRAGYLLRRRIAATPYRAYYWSLAGDLYFRRAAAHRRLGPIDLGSLSEDPIENLSSADWMGLAAIRTATTLEPNNYIYHDLLAGYFIDLGSPVLAAPACRDAVAAYPVLQEHRYILSSGPDPVFIECAVAGFDFALKRESMIPRPDIEAAAGYLLVRHKLDREAVPYFQRAIELSPGLFEAWFYLGLIDYRAGEYQRALERFEKAASLEPSSARARYYQGLALRSLGINDRAAEAFREAKERKPKDMRYSHALGGSLEALGRIDEAERQFVAAANLHPDSVEALSALLAFYFRNSDPKGTFDTCSRLLKIVPGNPTYVQLCKDALGGMP